MLSPLAFHLCNPRPQRSSGAGTEPRLGHRPRPERGWGGPNPSRHHRDRVGEGRQKAGPAGSARPPPAGRAAFLGGRRSDVDSGAASAAWGGRGPGGFLNPPPRPGPHFPSTAPPPEGERRRERERDRGAEEALRVPPARAREKLIAQRRAANPAVAPRQRPDSDPARAQPRPSRQPSPRPSPAPA